MAKNKRYRWQGFGSQGRGFAKTEVPSPATFAQMRYLTRLRQWAGESPLKGTPSRDWASRDIERLVEARKARRP